jgi:hypothetical protein
VRSASKLTTVGGHSRKIRRIHGIEQPRIADGRGSHARLFRRLVAAYVRELGGEDSLSELDKGQIAQLVTIEVRLASLRQAVLEGKDVPDDVVIRLGSEHRRALNALRSKAKAKPAMPSIDELFAVKASGAESFFRGSPQSMVSIPGPAGKRSSNRRTVCQ